MIKDLRLKNSSGFTLIEVLVYLGLLSIIMSGALTTAYYLLGTSQKSDDRISENEEKNFLVGTFGWALDGAYQINFPEAGQKGNILSVNKKGFDKNPVLFILADKKIYLGLGNDLSFALNTQRLPIDSFEAENIKSSSSQGVKINFATGRQNLNIIKYLRQ